MISPNARGFWLKEPSAKIHFEKMIPAKHPNSFLKIIGSCRRVDSRSRLPEFADWLLVVFVSVLVTDNLDLDLNLDPDLDLGLDLGVEWI